MNGMIEFRFSCTSKKDGRIFITSLPYDHLITPKNNETKMNAYLNKISEKYNELNKECVINWMSVRFVNRGIPVLEYKFKDINYFFNNIKLFISIDSVSGIQVPGLIDNKKRIRIDLEDIMFPVIWNKEEE